MTYTGLLIPSSHARSRAGAAKSATEVLCRPCAPRLAAQFRSPTRQRATHPPPLQRTLGFSVPLHHCRWGGWRGGSGGEGPTMRSLKAPGSGDWPASGVRSSILMRQTRQKSPPGRSVTLEKNSQMQNDFGKMCPQIGSEMSKFVHRRGCMRTNPVTSPR